MATRNEKERGYGARQRGSKENLFSANLAVRLSASSASSGQAVTYVQHTEELKFDTESVRWPDCVYEAKTCDLRYAVENAL